MPDIGNIASAKPKGRIQASRNNCPSAESQGSGLDRPREPRSPPHAKSRWDKFKLPSVDKYFLRPSCCLCLANESSMLGCSSNFDLRHGFVERAYCIWPDAVVRRGGESRFVRAIIMLICIGKYAGTENKHSLFSTDGVLSILLFASSTGCP